jgi:hypothetical protein
MAGQQYVTRSGGLTKPSERRRYRDALARRRRLKKAARRAAHETRVAAARGAVGGGATAATSETPGPSPSASASAPSAAVGVESGGRDPISLNRRSAPKFSNSIASRRRSMMSITFGPCFAMFML